MDKDERKREHIRNEKIEKKDGMKGKTERVLKLKMKEKMREKRERENRKLRRMKKEERE